jgi:GT2 family glycosyltransferase
MRVTVVDSGSGDDTPAVAEREFGWTEVIRCPRNVGFAAANNLVLRQTDAPASLLLNPDTEIRPATLDRCLDRLHGDPKIGVVGAKLVLPSGELDHACKRSFPTPVSALAHFTGLARREEASARLRQYRAPHLAEDEPGEVDAVNGAFMLVRMDAVREVGLLDEGYWLYMEDLDWCYRFHQRGWKVWYEPSAVATHVKGGSSGERRGLRQEVAFHRGMGRFYRKFYAAQRPAPLNALVYAGIGAKLATSFAITGARRLRPIR